MSAKSVLKVARIDFAGNSFNWPIRRRKPDVSSAYPIFLQVVSSERVKGYLIYFITQTSGRDRMGRSRKKTLRVVHRTLPTVFACPRCGLISIRITSEQDEASQDYVFRVTCGNPNCPLHAGREMRYATKRANIDVYNTFVDDYAKAGA